MGLCLANVVYRLTRFFHRENVSYFFAEPEMVAGEGGAMGIAGIL
jgi:hypothetical protein